jgi:hypothetical protein
MLLERRLNKQQHEQAQDRGRSAGAAVQQMPDDAALPSPVPSLRRLTSVHDSPVPRAVGGPTLLQQKTAEACSSPKFSMVHALIAGFAGLEEVITTNYDTWYHSFCCLFGYCFV